MVIILILIIIIFIALILFSFPSFSPIPYFPTNKKDLPLIIKALDLKNNQVIFDLGAGDGVVIFEAAKQALLKKLNTKFVCIEINPVLILILLLRRLFHHNKNNVQIIWGNFFKINIKNQMSNIKNTNQKSKIKNHLTIYLYLSPWIIEKVIRNWKFPACRQSREIGNFSIVSYMYPLSNRKPKNILTGKNKVFAY